LDAYQAGGGGCHAKNPNPTWAAQLDTVIDRLIQSRVHRLWITDENQKPVGVVALTDVIRTLLA